MKTIALTITQREYEKLEARAERAHLPLAAYIVAAASNPIKFAWPEDDKSPIADLNT